jgi:hypothetical protein
VSFTQKPVVYPPTFGYSAPPLSSFLFPRFYSSSRYPHHPPNPVHHPSTIISSPDSLSLLKAFHPSNNPLSTNARIFSNSFIVVPFFPLLFLLYRRSFFPAFIPHQDIRIILPTLFVISPQNAPSIE